MRAEERRVWRAVRRERAARAPRWLAGYAAATFLAFPHPLAGRVVDLGALFAYVAPALLLLALRGLAPRARRAAGRRRQPAGRTPAVLHWIYVVTVVYGHAPVAVGVAGAGAARRCIRRSSRRAFGAAFAALARAPCAAPFAVAALWTALSTTRAPSCSAAFRGRTLGYAQHENFGAAAAGVLRPASTALSFASALGGAGLAALARGRWRAAALAAAGVALAHGAGLALARAPRGRRRAPSERSRRRCCRETSTRA